MDDGPDSLLTLDSHLEAGSAHPDIGPRLRNEVGQYLGTVIVTNVSGAQWRLWPNGHPVVRLPSGDDLDVMAQAGHVTDHHGTLTALYNAARQPIA